MPQIEHVIVNWIIGASDVGWKRADTIGAVFTKDKSLVIINGLRTKLAVYEVSTTEVDVKLLCRFTQNNVEELIQWAE